MNNSTCEVQFIHMKIQEHIIMQLTNIPRYRTYQACPRGGFTSMHANSSDPYISIISWKFICLLTSLTRTFLSTISSQGCVQKFHIFFGGA